MLTSDRLAGVVLALFALFVVWEGQKLPFGTFREPGPGYMPVLLAVVLLCSGIVIAAMSRLAPRLSAMRWVEGWHATAILAACAFAAFALERLGYRLTVLVVLLFLLKVVEQKGWLLTTAFSLGMAFGTFFVFDTILRVPLPRGPWGL